MNATKLILLAGAAFLFLKDRLIIGDENNYTYSDYKSLLETLNKKIEDLENTVLEQGKQIADNEFYKNGDLAPYLKCRMNAYVSRLFWGFREWYSYYELEVDNIGKEEINLAAVRVFWTCEGRTALWSPWSTAGYRIKPGKKMTIPLHGNSVIQWIFGSPADISYIYDKFWKFGSNGFIKEANSAFYKSVIYLPIKCEAEFILAANGEKFVGHVSNFKGQLWAYNGDKTWASMNTVTNGTNVKAINDVVSPKEEEKK